MFPSGELQHVWQFPSDPNPNPIHASGPIHSHIFKRAALPQQETARSTPPTTPQHRTDLGESRSFRFIANCIVHVGPETLEGRSKRRDLHNERCREIHAEDFVLGSALLGNVLNRLRRVREEKGRDVNDPRGVESFLNPGLFVLERQVANPLTT